MSTMFNNNTPKNNGNKAALAPLANNRFSAPTIKAMNVRTGGFSLQTNGTSKILPLTTGSGANRMQQSSSYSNRTPLSSSWENAGKKTKRRSDALQIQPIKLPRAAKNIVDIENEDPSANAVNSTIMYEFMTQIRSILPTIEKMTGNIANINTTVNDIIMDVNEMKEKNESKDGTKSRKTKISAVSWKESFAESYGFNIDGKFVRVKEFSGDNAKKQVAEIIKQHQDEKIWNCPMYNGVSLKDEIQQYLKDTFEKIDYPSKVGYFVGQFLWHPDHFLKNHMSTIKPRGNKVNDASRNDIPAEEKQLFLDIMLYCGGFLIHRCRNGEGKKLAHDADNWLEWVSYGREALNTRGKQDEKKGDEATSTVTKEMPIDFVPIFCRSEEHWEEMRQRQVESESALEKGDEAHGNEENAEEDETPVNNETVVENENNNQQVENLPNSTQNTAPAWTEEDWILLDSIGNRPSASRSNSTTSSEARASELIGNKMHTPN